MSVDRLFQMMLRAMLNAFAHRLRTKWLVIGIVFLIIALFWGAAFLDLLPFEIKMK